MVRKENIQYNFNIDSKSAVPVYEQIKQAIKLLIMAGDLKESEQLWPIRELAEMLKVNPNTIVKVYYQLDVEGYIYSQAGSGFFVKKNYLNRQNETKDLFKKITDDYMTRALKLGYSLDDMIRELSKRNKKK